MTEPTGRDWMEIREWLVKIDTKMDMMSEVKTKADEAKATADEAKQMSKDNRDNIRDMKTTTKWAIGLIVPAIIAIAGLAITVAIAVFS